MKRFPYFITIFYLGIFFLLISCENTPPVENVEPPLPTLKETKVNVIETSPTIDTVKKVQKIVRPTRKPPKIKFMETSYTYDTIKQGDVIEYNFKFKNIGERPLTIKDVTGSCGCTIGSYPFLDIASKEESAIKARFDSKGKIGPQFTTITVYSNANPKGDVLSLKGVVVE